MRRLVALLLLGLGAAHAPARTGAEEVVARLSATRVAITTSFAGSEIFIYGAIKREAPAPDTRLGVVVAVIGPSEPVIVRKRERRFGVWVNGPGVEIDAAPSFYAVATTDGYFDTISHTDDLRYRVGLSQVIRLIDAPEWLEAERTSYLDAVVRLNRAEGHYFVNTGGVEVVEETLFNTSVDLPPDLVEGEYRARVFLTRDREVVDVHETSITVRKEGLERVLTVLAAEQGLVYGAASVALALAAGWIASALFRLILP
jgi:uncharacterized protein (TIGR02186 family)